MQRPSLTSSCSILWTSWWSTLRQSLRPGSFTSSCRCRRLVSVTVSGPNALANALNISFLVSCYRTSAVSGKLRIGRRGSHSDSADTNTDILIDSQWSPQQTLAAELASIDYETTGPYVPLTPLSYSRCHLVYADAWAGEYRGDSADHLIDAINKYCDPDCDQRFAKYLTILNSSGIGKSRLVDKAAERVLVVPMNLRSLGPGGAYLVREFRALLDAFWSPRHSNRVSCSRQHAS